MDNSKIEESRVNTQEGRIFVYFFFMLHSLVFGASTFSIAYGSHDLQFSQLFGGFAVFIYLIFYFILLGVDKVKNMFIGGLLGIAQTYAWIGLIASYYINPYSKMNSFEMFPWVFHIVPSIFFIMITFLLKNLIAEFFPENENKVFYTFSLFLFITPYIIKLSM